MSKFGSAMRRRPAGEGDAPPARPRTKSSGWAVAAGYLGLFSALPFVGPFAVICGLIALRDIRRRPGVRGAYRAKFGIVAGAAGAVFWSVLWLREKLG